MKRYIQIIAAILISVLGVTTYIQYEKVKMPIDSYLSNPSILTCINEEYIVEDNINIDKYNV